jgi:hypothetical protein
MNNRNVLTDKKLHTDPAAAHIAPLALKAAR